MAGLRQLRLRTPRLLELPSNEFVSPVAVEIAGLDGLHSRFGSDRLA